MANFSFPELSREIAIFHACLSLKVQRAEEMLKAAEKEREVTLSEEIPKLNGVRSQIEHKLKLLEPREREAEAMVSKGERLIQEAESARQSGIVKQLQLLSKREEIVQAVCLLVN